MTGLLLTGVAAGLASALLFASAGTGSLLSVILFYLATLPLMISGLGWGWLTAAVGGAIGAVAIGTMLAPLAGLVFFLTVGAPAAVLCYLALLSRTDPDGTVEWYPIGRLVLWTALMGAVLVGVAVYMVGTGMADFRNALVAMLSEMATVDTSGTAPDPANIEQLADNMIALLPSFAAALWLATTLLNLYIAGRVVRASGRLIRPWPDVARLDLPMTAAFGLLAATALWFAGGDIGRIAGPFAAALTLAFAFVGLGVVHVVSRGSSARGLILLGLYVITFLSAWPLLLLAALGIAEPQLRLRDRRPPPGGGPLSPS